VVSLDLVYEGATILPNGRAADPGIFPDTTYVSLNKECIRDMQWVLNEMNNASTKFGQFINRRVDFNRVGAAGHSYGGNLAMQLSVLDKRVKFSINLDGGDFSFVKDMKLSAPALILRERPDYSDDELRKKGRDPIKWRADSTKSLKVYLDFLKTSNTTGYLVRVNQTGHFSFSDAPYLMPSMLTRFLGTYLTPDRNLELISELMTTFILSCGINNNLKEFNNKFSEEKELMIVKIN
jgi:hypothetical protein